MTDDHLVSELKSQLQTLRNQFDFVFAELGDAKKRALASEAALNELRTIKPEDQRWHTPCPYCHCPEPQMAGE